MADKNLEENRQLALETLTFFQTEHNKALFKLSAVRNQLINPRFSEKDAIEAIKTIKRRLRSEFQRCSPYLQEKDKENFFDLE